MNLREITEKFGHLLHFPWRPGESPDDYYERHLFALHGFRETGGMAVVQDILEARQREIWSSFESMKDADPAKLADLHTRASEVAFLARMLDRKSNELSTRASKAAELESKERQQKRMALDHVLSGRKQTLASHSTVV